MKEYISLKENFCLRKECLKAIIFDKRFENTLNYYQSVPLEHFGVLCLLDGRFTKDNLINLYSEACGFDQEFAKEEIEFILLHYDRYIQYNENCILRRDLIINHIENKPKRNYCSEHRLDFPLVLSLVLTYRCECFCEYCFVNANSEKRFAMELSCKKIKDLIDEAVAYGTYAVNITGGDPFTRKDIFEIISYCVEKNLCINISTKVCLSDEKIQLLINTGLKRIQISLDSVEEEEEYRLIGKSNYPEQMIECIRKLLKAGMEVVVNTVVTKINIHSIPKLIAELEEVGVLKAYITPYLRTLGRHDDKLFPSEVEYDALSDYIYSYNGGMTIDYKEPNYTGETGECYRCTGGRMGIVIMPNGDVSICERLIDTKECCVGNVYDKPLREIWDGKELYRLIQPEKEKFKGTDCYTCQEFDACIWDRGLCYARCKFNQRDIFNKDPLCRFATVKMRFV